MARTSISSNLEARLDSLKDSVRNLLDTSSRGASNLKNSALTGANKLGRPIKAHPIVSVAIALGAGYVVMRMIRR